MTIFAYALLAAATSSAPILAPSFEGVRWAQLTIQRRVVIRVPNVTTIRVPEPRIRWTEQKGPKCVPVSQLAGYAITRPDSIDLVIRGGARYRARLEDDCPSIAFYSGFYVRPPGDGRICVGRDVIHSRAGGQCGIEKFRTLVPER